MDTREKFIQTTSRLIESQGYHATGLNQITEESGAPRGSLYYHFPGGKDELVAEAVKVNGEIFAGLIRENMREDVSPGESIREFVMGVARGVKATNFQAGGPLTIVASETANSSERLNQACATAYRLIQSAIAEKLLTTGAPESQAPDLASFIVATIEGGIILSRTEHSVKPLINAGNLLGDLIPQIPHFRSNAINFERSNSG